MVEEWGDVKGYEGLYLVSNTGKVKSLHYNKEIILKSTKGTKGYLLVCLTKNGKTKTCKIHKLVAQTFIPNPENKSQVNHIDGNKQNNSVSNLEWVTNQENISHAWKIGLNENSRKKAVIQMDLNGNFIREFSSGIEASRYYGKKYLHKCISMCCNGEHETAYGYKWRFK